MAEGHSMTVAGVVADALAGEVGDFLREAVALVARELMEAEISAQIGAGWGGLSAERRTHRNGYRSRAWETRVGEIELLIPRARSGPAHFPSFLEPRRRAEQAIAAVVLEAYVDGVSTRKVDRPVEQLGLQGMTKDRVSALCRALDEEVEAFRSRRLEGACPRLVACFLALVCEAELFLRLAAQEGGRASYPEVVSDPKALSAIELSIGEQRYLARTELRPHAHAAFRACGLRPPPPVQAPRGERSGTPPRPCAFPLQR